MRRLDPAGRERLARLEAERIAEETTLRLYRANEQLREARRRLEALNADLERRVDERTTEVQALNAELDAFASTVSHDLRSPLSAARLSVATIRNGLAADDETQLQRVDRIDRSLLRMEDLITRLLAEARSARAPDLAPVDLHDVLDAVLEDLAPDLVDARVDVEPLPTVRADATLMRQVLQNLLANAARYRAERPLVLRVAPAKAATMHGFAVHDNGIGIDPEQAHRLFDRHHRGSDTGDGLGLGLATCRRIVERHGGTIHATGQPGIGSTFTVLLPLPS